MATRSTAPRARKQVNYTWAGFVTGPIILAANTKILLGSFVLSTPFEETAVRTRGNFYIGSDQAAVVEQQTGAIGLIRVTASALAIGITAIPDPVTNSDDDGWFVWQGFSQESSLTTTAGLAGGHVYEIDSKAQRIVREGQVIAVVAVNSQAAAGLHLGINFRLLSRFRG